MTAHQAHAGGAAAMPIWVEMRAVKAPDQSYSWHIEGRTDPDSDPNDPESWSWVADVDGTEHIFDHEPGETAHALAHQWNAHAALVEALEAIERHHIEMNRAIGRDEARSKTLALARAALELAKGEQS